MSLNKRRKRIRKKDNKSLEGKEILNNEESSEEGLHMWQEEHVKSEGRKADRRKNGEV
jgi:hypothetical protein